MVRAELGPWLRLVLTPGIGNETARKLMTALGPPASVFAAPQSALRELVGRSQASALADEPAALAAQLDLTLAWLAAAEPEIPRRVLCLDNAAYPTALWNIEDPPLMLYTLGGAKGAWPPGLAVVGSRNPTPQGRVNAHHFARSLTQNGLTVVSGLALGIDAAAHEGALEGAGPDRLATIAVVGTGLDRVYPRQHEALAERIARHGVLVSEYPLGTPPLAANFPRRNRLIAGLSEGTLVVEAAVQSGSLITARLAAEQGKEVFAIPGSIHSPQSRGCHRLIRQGAKLVESVQDVLEELRPGQIATAATPDTDAANRSAAPASAADRMLDVMGFDPVSLDMLMARTGMAAAPLQARLLELELSGQVARLPGALFQRVFTG